MAYIQQWIFELAAMVINVIHLGDRLRDDRLAMRVNVAPLERSNIVVTDPPRHIEEWRARRRS